MCMFGPNEFEFVSFVIHFTHKKLWQMLAEVITASAHLLGRNIAWPVNL